jgi:hypothetical protein
MPPGAVLRSADVRITVSSPTSCDVTIDLAVAGAAEIDHRVEAFDDTRIELVDVRGARQAESVRAIGRTQSLALKPDGEQYGFHYRASNTHANRCPIWLPAVPTHGDPGAVRLTVDIPAATVAGSTLPAFAWTRSRGVATLAHVPAIVRVPYSREGEPRGWDVGRTMDAIAVIVFVAASAVWLWRARR